MKGSSHLVRLYSLSLTLSAFPAAAASGDENWDDHFGLPPGLNGEVSSVVTLGKDVYVGGWFTKAGGTNASGIARWDGKQWSALGCGLAGVVNALVGHGQDLFVGGQFRFTGSIAATNIAKWNGEHWEELSTGIGESSLLNLQAVYALAVQGKNLYVGGRFQSAGGVEARNIAKWDGRRWSALGTGIGDPILVAPELTEHFGEVHALTFQGPYLYAGGIFHHAGGVSTTNLARWDGKRWTGFCPGVSGGPFGFGIGGGDEYDGIVRTLAVRGKDLYVGGNFTNAGGVFANNLAKWDGSVWTEVGGGVDGSVHRILRQGQDLLVGGLFTKAGDPPVKNLARWNGSRWSALANGVSGPVLALASKGKKLYAGGDFGLASGTQAAFIAQWDGQAWSALDRGTGNALIGQPMALAAQGQTVYVGGQLYSAGNIELTNLAKWDGTNWSDVGGGVPNAGIRAIVAAGTKVYVGGAFERPGIGATNIACWDGASWSGLGGGLHDGEHAAFPAALAGSGSNLYVSGSFTTAGGVAATNLAVWNGTSWSDVGGGVTSMFSPAGSRPGSVYSLVADGDVLYVAGYFSHAGSVAATNLAKWDGQGWSAVGGGLPLPEGSQVNRLAVGGGDLYVAAIAPLNFGSLRLLKWDGAAWSELPLGPSPAGYIESMVVSGPSLYVGGGLNRWGGLTNATIVRWDGMTWSPLGSGVNRSVFALAVGANHLSAAGAFDTAGGKSSYRFAVWHEPTP